MQNVSVWMLVLDLYIEDDLSRFDIPDQLLCLSHKKIKCLGFLNVTSNYYSYERIWCDNIYVMYERKNVYNIDRIYVNRKINI